MAFVGRNGEGKSTLVKCIMGEIPFGGTLKIGHQVQIGYFAQNQAQMLDGELTVFDTIDRVATGDVRLQIKSILGAFMFGGEASEKKVKVLSGGERSRLAMIRLLLEPVNLLVLDEPTNHLDMPSKDVLKAAIKAFDGTAIIVSHDRDFLDGLVTKVYEFGGGKVKEHLGDINSFLSLSDVLSNLKKSSEKDIDASMKSAPLKLEKQNDSKPETPVLSYQERKEQQRKKSRLEKAVKEVEQLIAQKEQRLAELDETLCKPEHASNMTLVSEYTDLQQKLQVDMERWEELSIELSEYE